MRHSILLDPELQAALWRIRQPGEATLNDVLRRTLGLAAREPGASSQSVVLVERAGVRFLAGFAIFRLYKGREFHARAVDGGWLLEETGEIFSSLNKLSRGIGTGIENAWNYWRYRDAAGNAHLLATLRPRP